MTELSARNYGRIIAALQEYAEDHPDEQEADQLRDLAELITDHSVITIEAVTVATTTSEKPSTDGSRSRAKNQVGARS